MIFSYQMRLAFRLIFDYYPHGTGGLSKIKIRKRQIYTSLCEQCEYPENTQVSACNIEKPEEIFWEFVNMLSEDKSCEKKIVVNRYHPHGFWTLLRWIRVHTSDSISVTRMLNLSLFLSDYKDTRLYLRMNVTFWIIFFDTIGVNLILFAGWRKLMEFSSVKAMWIFRLKVMGTLCDVVIME